MTLQSSNMLQQTPKRVIGGAGGADIAVRDVKAVSRKDEYRRDMVTLQEENKVLRK